MRSSARCGRSTLPRDGFLWNTRDLTLWITRRIRSHNKAGEENEPEGKDCSLSDLSRQRPGHEKIKINTALCIPQDKWHQKDPWCVVGVTIIVVYTSVLVCSQVIHGLKYTEPHVWFTSMLASLCDDTDVNSFIFDGWWQINLSPCSDCSKESWCSNFQIHRPSFKGHLRTESCSGFIQFHIR